MAEAIVSKIERAMIGELRSQSIIVIVRSLRSERLEGWGHQPGLVVRDGAHAPPHHEGWD